MKTLYRKKYYKKKPWAKTLEYIGNRIRYNSAYNGKSRQIKNFLTTEDLKKLWFRDKAYLMKIPSIDRVNPLNDYTFKNCRYLELRENQSRKKHIYQRHKDYILKGRWSKNYKKCIICGTQSIPHCGNGKCKSCYNKGYSKTHREYYNSYLRKWRVRNGKTIKNRVG